MAATRAAPAFSIKPMMAGLLSFLKRNLRYAGMKEKPEQYLRRSLSFSIGAFLFVLVFGMLTVPTLAFLFAASAFAAFLALSLSIPRFSAMSRAKQVEGELGITLQTVSLLLAFGKGFNESLSEAPKGKLTSKLFSKYFRRVESGSSPVAAFASLSEEIDSAAWKRACSQLSFTYQNGNSGGYLDACADELFQITRARMKKFAARLSMLGLAFSAAGCLLPVVFGAFAMMSPLFGQPVNEFDIFLWFWVLIPLGCAGILSIARLSSPPAPGFGFGTSASTAKGARFSVSKSLAAISVLLPAAVLFFDPFPKVRFALAFCCIFLPWAAKSAMDGLSLSKRQADLESALPTALMMAASYPSSSIDQVPKSLASCGMGEVSKAFGGISKLIDAGYSFEAAVSNAASKYPASPMFSQACIFLKAAYANGFEAGPAMQKMGGYFSEMHSLSSDLASALTVTKYTILSSALVWVPYLSSVLLGIARSIPEMGMTMLAPFSLAISGYLIIFSLVGGIFVGLSEGDFWRGLGYALFCAPISLVVFSLAC